MSLARPSTGIIVAGKPRFLATLIFLLLFTGPPKFRFRDPESSVYGELDLSAIVQILVWAAAGIWTLWHIMRPGTAVIRHLRLRGIHPAGIAFVVVLGASTLVSLAPALTAFKVYQVLVLLLFCSVFVQRYGIDAGLDRLLLGNLLLCAAIGVALLFAPELVLFTSDTGAARLTGRGVAETGIVATFATILLLTTRRRVPKAVLLVLLGSLGALIFFSLMRTAYVVLGTFLILALIRRPEAKQLRLVLVLSGLMAAIALLVGLVPNLSEYRDPETLFTLSDRLGLWAHFIERTLAESPWLGMGFVSGVRVLGLEYNPELGSGHSIFFEAFVGAGLIGLVVFVWLFFRLSVDGAWMFFRRRDALSFGLASLLVAVLLFGLIGGELDSGQMGFTLWFLLAAIPSLRRQSLLYDRQARRASVLPALGPQGASTVTSGQSVRTRA